MHIYILQNKINNKIYIGQTIDFEARLERHIRGAKKDLRHLYCAIRKYGWHNFNYFIIEEIDLLEINEAECFWIDYFRSWDRAFGYNLTRGGEGGIPTKETRAKMRLAKLGKPNPNMQGENHPLYGITGENHHRFGTTHTDEAKRKIAEANIGRDFPKGSGVYNSLLTEEDVLYMRKYFSENTHIKTKEIVKYLAEHFSIMEGTVESIIYNLSWKHVEQFETKNKNKKLQKDDVIYIRQEMQSTNNKSIRRRELAAKYNISISAIYDIEAKRRWKNI